MAPIIIDNETKLKALLSHIAECVREEKDQLIFVDIEGVNLGRLGQVAIMQLMMPPTPVVYLVDIHILGVKAFSTSVDDDTNLKTILESQNIFKVFFDIRNDSDALHAHFGINIAGVLDLQVIEYATRNPRGKFVHGLAKCIEKDLPYMPGWSRVKMQGRRLFAPELGGQYEVFLQRPIDPDIVNYCEQDVTLMPKLLAYYGQKLQKGVAAQLPAIVSERIQLSKTITYNGKGRHMAIGPYIAPARAETSMPTSREFEIMCSDKLRQLCRLDSIDVGHLTARFDTMLVSQGEPTNSNSAVSDGEISNSDQALSSDETSAAVTHIDIADLPTTFSTLRKDVYEKDDADGHSLDGWRTGYRGIDSDDGADQDYTACSADDCGYCGKCSY